jgi:hypothetical protein
MSDLKATKPEIFIFLQALEEEIEKFESIIYEHGRICNRLLPMQESPEDEQPLIKGEITVLHEASRLLMKLKVTNNRLQEQAGHLLRIIGE